MDKNKAVLTLSWSDYQTQYRRNINIGSKLRGCYNEMAIILRWSLKWGGCYIEVLLYIVNLVSISQTVTQFMVTKRNKK